MYIVYSFGSSLRTKISRRVQPASGSKRLLYSCAKRRSVLRAAGVGAASLLASSAATAGAESPAQPQKSCIFIWLNGGPSQFETFDPKPNASDDIRGPFGAIRTQVPGILVSELIPCLAKQFDKYSIVRTMAHRNSDHGSTAMLTGIEAGDVPYGAVVTKLLGPAETDTITFNAPFVPGEYLYVCSFPGHYSQGTKGIMTVKP
jgi:hypothetical protein